MSSLRGSSRVPPAVPDPPEPSDCGDYCVHGLLAQQTAGVGSRFSDRDKDKEGRSW